LFLPTNSSASIADVDEFDSYADDAALRASWVTTHTKDTVYVRTPGYETSTQSMKLVYNNGADPWWTEVKMTFGSVQDWSTYENVSCWYMGMYPGDPNNSGEKFFLRVYDEWGGSFDGPKIDNATKTWAWNYYSMDISGWANSGNVAAVAIILEPMDYGSGLFHVDRIRIDTGPPTTAYVDDDYCAGCANDGHTWTYDAFDKVQEGVDAVEVGGTVMVAAGTYEEEVEIAKNMTVSGAGSGSTIILSPDNLTQFFTTSANNYPIVWIHDAMDVTLEDLTVDGAGKGNANARFLGVAFNNAGGTIQDCVLTGIRETPFSGAQHGVALYAWGDDTVSRSIDVLNNTFVDFQKNAMALNADSSTPLTVDVTGNTITGAGATTVTAQNGVQVWAAMGSGTVEDNTITGIGYDGASWTASSILTYFASLDIIDNTVTGAQTGVYDYAASSLSVTGNNFTIENIGDGGQGILIYDPIPNPPSPFDPVEEPGENMTFGLASTHSMSITENVVTFSGVDNTGCYGIIAWAGVLPDDLDISVDRNEVTGFEIGIGFVSYDPGTAVFTNADANFNLLSGNTFGMYSDGDYMTVDGEYNWWGDASGPAHETLNAGAVGDSVTNYIDFEPWLGSTNHASVVPDYVTTNCTDPVSVDFYLTQAGLGQEVRGYDLTFTVNNAVVTVASASGDITEGSYLQSVGTTQFYPIDLGGGTYRVSCAILGGDEGGSGNGTLFSVELTPVAEGTSDITITDFKLRDLNNVPLTTSYTDGFVRIDCTVPTMEPIAEAEGGWYNTAPVLSNFGFDDDINLDTAEYQIDSDGWVTLFSGIDATEWNDDGWTLPGFGPLSEGSHTVYFRVADDAGNWNGEGTPDTYSWQFYKDTIAPDPVSDFDAAPGHNKVHLTWTNPVGDATFEGVELRRVGWTDYPEYDIAAPSYPANETEGDFVAQLAAEAYDDSITIGRDIYYFSAFCYDSAGNYSSYDVDASDRATSYWLGDVAAGYDGMVNSTDLVDFSATFSVSDGGPGWNNECDFGPTDDFSSFGIPLPDNVIDFEDLMIFAMIYGNVTPSMMTFELAEAIAAERLDGLVNFELVEITDDSAPEGCVVLSVRCENKAKTLKGFEITLDAAGGIVSVDRGAIFDGAGDIFFGTAGGEMTPMSVCVAALGVGTPLNCSGEVARITLDAGAGGGIRLGDIDVRDIGNRSSKIQGGGGYEPSYTPKAYALIQNYPNPFNPSTSIAFDIVKEGRVTISIFDVSGRLVRTLLDEPKDPGRHVVTWNGRDHSGSVVPSGVYFYQIDAGDYTATKKMIRLP
jgi:hypothetical protein